MKAQGTQFYRVTIKVDEIVSENRFTLPFSNIYEERVFKRNSNGKYSFAIQLVRGKHFLGTSVPKDGIFLTADEFDTFEQDTDKKHKLEGFILLAIYGDIEQDIIIPNETVFKNGYFGSHLVAREHKIDIKNMIKKIEEYVPVEIIRPMIHTNTFMGDGAQKKELLPREN